MSPNIDVLAIGDGSEPRLTTQTKISGKLQKYHQTKTSSPSVPDGLEGPKTTKLNICENVQKCRQIDILDISTDGSECRKTTKKRISENLQTWHQTQTSSPSVQQDGWEPQNTTYRRSLEICKKKKPKTENIIATSTDLFVTKHPTPDNLYITNPTTTNKITDSTTKTQHRQIRRSADRNEPNSVNNPTLGLIQTVEPT